MAKIKGQIQLGSLPCNKFQAQWGWILILSKVVLSLKGTRRFGILGKKVLYKTSRLK